VSIPGGAGDDVPFRHRLLFILRAIQGSAQRQCDLASRELQQVETRRSLRVRQKRRCVTSKARNLHVIVDRYAAPAEVIEKGPIDLAIELAIRTFVGGTSCLACRGCLFRRIAGGVADEVEFPKIRGSRTTAVNPMTLADGMEQL
jgi:hypothetical protein